MLFPKITKTIKIEPLQNRKTIWKHLRPTEMSSYLKFHYVLLTVSTQFIPECTHLHTVSHVTSQFQTSTWTWLPLQCQGHTSGQGSPGGRVPSALQILLFSPGGLWETRLCLGNAWQAGPRCGKQAQMPSDPRPGQGGPAGPCSERLRRLKNWFKVWVKNLE